MPGSAAPEGRASGPPEPRAPERRPAMVLRRAVAADVPQLTELAGQLGYPVAQADLARRLAGLSPDDEVSVVEVDGRVAGWIHLSSYRTLLSEPHVEVLGLVVREGFRGRGIGRRLMDHAATWGLERGLRAVYLRSGVQRVEAHGFYAGLGFGEIKQQRVFVKQTRP